MDMFNACRIAALLGGLATLSACTSNGNTVENLDGTPPPLSTAEAEGTVPDYCPNVALREGTAILRRGDGETLQYVASITSTSRECRVLDGELRMKIGLAGRVVPGPAAKPGEVGLPIRVAIVQGTEVLYSQQGASAVTLGNQGAQQFVFVDQNVVVPEPTSKNLVIYAGFDEGPES